MSSDALQNLAQALFVLPFFLFSATAGQIADKYEKSRLITVTAAIELACMALGAVGFLMENLALLLAALFLGGLQSTLFGPVKYAILPQHLRERELVGGNGLVEMGTSVAILAGMMLGGWMVTRPGWGIAGVGVLVVSLSALGIALSRFIPCRLFTRNRHRLRHARRLFPRVRLSVGEPVAAAAATPQALRLAVSSLRGPWR